MSEHLVRDVYPAEVTEAGTVVATAARVFITNERAMVYEAGPDKVVRLTAMMELVDPKPATVRSPGRGSIELTTTDGRTMWVNKGKGCGCRSPLRVMVPPYSWPG